MESPRDLVFHRVMGRDPLRYNSSVDPLDWLTFVYPRFADFYQEALKDRSPSKDQLQPKLEVFCLINVPKIVRLKLKDLDELIEVCFSQDGNRVCSWDRDVINRPGNNWTFTCPSGSASNRDFQQYHHFRCQIFGSGGEFTFVSDFPDITTYTRTWHCVIEDTQDSSKVPWSSPVNSTINDVNYIC